MAAEEHSGWLLDLYPNPAGGITLWLLADGSPTRLKLHMAFPLTFYAAGDFPTLRRAWRFLQDKGVSLARAERRDLFSGERSVLSVTLPEPARLPGLFRELSEQFSSLDYYDADLPLSLRFAARTGVGLLGRCRVTADQGWVGSLHSLESPWELEPQPLPLRILQVGPEVDPALRPPRKLRVRYERADFWLSLEPPRALEASLEGILRRSDPDLILSEYGDTWLFPKLGAWFPSFNPNRDPERAVLTRQADSYFAYGQVVYRGAQAHLFGRWHIDRRNAMMFGEYGLEGVLEQARVTGMGVQEMARKSPGAGITAMQMLTALRTGVLVPVVKQQAEGRKTLVELIRADKGGLIYQPLTGVHRHVAQIDFASMYPSIMVKHNISPETVGKEDAPDGLVPQTLRPLLEKRLALKRRLLDLDPRDCRVKPLKARAAALKWLLVVCFGYLGYKNARFGKIESHEAVTAFSREWMLQAKETAEELDFRVLHMYVDSLFVEKAGCQKPGDFIPLLEAIAARTGLSIALDGVYRWVAFLPSKRDRRIPVPNRYFGIFQSGEIKARGIALRRRDTPAFVADLQKGLLQILAQTEDPRERIPEARAYLQSQLRRLREGKIPRADLVVSQTLSREVEAYRVPSPAARAARQWQAQGREVRPGMRIRFLYVLGPEGVQAWDGEGAVDVAQYRRLAERAAQEILLIFEDEREMGLFEFRVPFSLGTQTQAFTSKVSEKGFTNRTPSRICPS